MIKKIKLYTLMSILMAPVLASASHGPSDLFGVIDIFFGIFRALVPVIFGLALVAFLWGVAKYILNAADATKRKEGNAMMLYGIIALFVMLSIWGLVALLGGTFGINVGLPVLPTR